MNEWSPGGNYSRPGTPNQSGRSFRSQWDEPEKGTKPLVVNIRAISDNRSKSFHQQSMDETSKTSISTGTRNKRNGTSDPRFKRVITNGNLNDACVGTELKPSKPCLICENKEDHKTKIPTWSSTEFKTNEDLSSLHCSCEPKEYDNIPTNEPPTLDQSQEPLKAVDKLSFSHDIVAKSFSKDTLSDITVNTGNTSLASEDLVDELSNDLSLLRELSATRVTKVQGEKAKPEKKQSVITVIGQMQDTLSSALREIDKRRKLVKELDRYAVCKKIVDTEKDKEISNLVAKINRIPSGKGSCNDSRLQDSNKTSMISSRLRANGDKLDKYQDLPEKDLSDSLLSPTHEVIPPSSTSLSQKRLSSRKKSKKYHLASEYLIKGKIREVFNRMQLQWIFCVMIIFSGFLCYVTFNSIPRGNYVSFDLFSTKPKPMTWYERICSWIWELFRPSANYQRSVAWHPY